MAVAQAALRLAQTRLDKDLARPTATDVAAADVLVQQAQQRLDAAEQSLADTREQSKTTIRAAKDSYDLARRIRRRHVDQNQPQSVTEADWRAEYAARAAWRNAVKLGKANDNRAGQAVEAAALALDAAKRAYEAAIAPASSDAIAAGELAVAQARASLVAAQGVLTGARLVAPVDGVVSEVSLVIGMSPKSGDAILIQQGPMEATLRVPEDQVLSFDPGNRVGLYVAALGLDLSGTVTRVGLTTSPSGGVVLYPVTVSLDEPPLVLRPGMTVKVTDRDG